MTSLFHNLKNKLTSTHLSTVLSNIGWLLFDRFFRMSINLFVISWIIRYLGPEQFGILNYAQAIIAFFFAFIVFGLNSITVKNLVSHPKQSDDILGSCFLIQSTLASISFLVLLLITTFLYKEYTPQLVTIIIGLSILLKPSDTIRYYFEANIQSKYIVWSENCSFIICSSLKIILMLYQASFIAIVCVFLLEAILSSILLLIFYTYQKQSILKWRFSLAQIKQDLKDCWPLMFANFTIIIYMRIDQIMLGQILDYSAVGIYTAAIRISEIFYLLPVIVVSSANPLLIRLRESNKALYYQKIYLIMLFLAWISILVALTITYTAPFIINILFGSQYTEATDILIIHIWTGIFVSIGVMSGQWFVIENLQKLYMYRSVFGAVINIAANMVLIPKLGIKGAAIATLFAQISATFLFDLFNVQTRRIFWLKLNTINPFYIIKSLQKNKLYQN